MMIATFFLLYAKSDLLFVEMQGIVGYHNKPVFHSYDESMPMQKSSLGIDYIRKFSSDRELGTVALQLRLAYDGDLEWQLYNAYFKFKTKNSLNIWVGHKNLSFGLSSYLDTHSDILATLPMYGIGLDKDTAIGLSKDLPKGDFALTFSSGSEKLGKSGGGLISGRISYGILNYDGHNLGISILRGKIKYQHMMDKMSVFLGGIDFAYDYTYFEHRLQLFAGKEDRGLWGIFYRLSAKLLDEGRLRLDGQVFYRKSRESFYELAFGPSYRLNSYFDVKFAYAYQQNDQRSVFQLYYYFPVS
jgi:hypothetical protein